MDILQVERTLFETGYIINTYTSNREILQLAIGTDLNCATDYYGDDCDTFCRLTDDDTGHYACYSSGEKACLSGYMNPEMNCTEPCELIIQCNLALFVSPLDGINKSDCWVQK